MIKFVIFGHPRCGSTHLCSLLTSHPKIVCHYEVFHPKEIGFDRGVSDKIDALKSYTVRERDKDPVGFINTLYEHNRGAEAVGFKIFVNHSKSAHDFLLNDRSVKKIILRRSIIQSYVSMEIANATGEFTAKSSTPGRQRTVAIDARGLLGFERKIREYFFGIRKILHDTDQDFFELTYEQLSEDPETIASLVAFLGIDRGKTKFRSFTRKQNKPNLAEKIENIEGLISGLTAQYFEKEDACRSGEGHVERLKSLLSKLTRE